MIQEDKNPSLLIKTFKPEDLRMAQVLSAQQVGVGTNPSAISYFAAINDALPKESLFTNVSASNSSEKPIALETPTVPTGNTKDRGGIVV